MSDANDIGPEWWKHANGWALKGVHTPMRRCGLCKDALSDLQRERGLCARCATAQADRQRRDEWERKRAELEAKRASEPEPAEQDWYDQAEGY